MQPEPRTTGMVVGDTWLDVMRVIQHHDFLYFVVDRVGPSHPVTGIVHVDGIRQESFLWLDECVTMRKIVKAEPGCFVVDLELMMLSLQFPELDGIPILCSVTSAAEEVPAGEAVSVTVLTVVKLMTIGNGGCYSYWPCIDHVTSYEDGNVVNKELCVGQLLGLLQFPMIPRHPIRYVLIKSVNWALTSSGWTTTQHTAAQEKIKKKATSECWRHSH